MGSERREAHMRNLAAMLACAHHCERIACTSRARVPLASHRVLRGDGRRGGEALWVGVDDVLVEERAGVD
eukprot:4862665-Pleurochrysis_carterae.AAC.1